MANASQMGSRPYDRSRDGEAVLALRARVWGADHPHTTAAFHDWLFDGAPSGRGGGAVYELRGRIVAFAGFAHRAARWGARSLTLAHGLDFMADPELGGVLSGRAALMTLRTHVEHIGSLGFDATFNFPNENSERMLTSDKMGYSLILTPTLHVLPLPAFERQVPGTSRWRRLGESLGARAIFRLMRLRALVGARGQDIRLTEVSRFDKRFDALWETISADGRLRLDRSADTLNWRFADHPVYDYRIVVAESGAATLGYAVVSPRRLYGLAANLVCDLVVPHGRGDVAASLLGHCVRDAIVQKAGAIAAYASPGSPEAAALRAAGFIPVPGALNPRPCKLVLRSTAADTAIERCGAAWAFAWGDTDVA